VLVTLGVGFAAVNTGNNLLFLVLGMMLGLIVVSGILSEVTLRDVDVRRRAPRRVEAQAVFPVELALLNRKGWAASFSVELRDEMDGQPFRRRCFFLRVGPGEERSIAYRCELSRRGVSRFDGTIVSTRFPFGLFEKSRFLPLEEEVLVLPGRIDARAPREASAPGEGGDTAGVRGSGQDFLELRAMAEGDDPRLIHWRSTARLGIPIVRVTERDSRGYAEIVLDAAAGGSEPAELEAAEQRIRLAGTLVRDLIARGLVVKLITAGGSGLEATTRFDAIRLLEHLALLDVAAASRGPAPSGTSAGAILIGPRAGSTGRSFRMASPRQGGAGERAS